MDYIDINGSYILLTAESNCKDKLFIKYLKERSLLHSRIANYTIRYIKLLESNNLYFDERSDYINYKYVKFSNNRIHKNIEN